MLTLGSEGGWFHNLRFSADGRHLGAIDEAGEIHLWQAPSWEEIEAQEKAERSVAAE